MSSVSRIKHESFNVAVAVVPVMAECLAWAAVPVGQGLPLDTNTTTTK